MKKLFGDLFLIPLRNGINRPSRMRGSGYKMINMGELFANDRIYDIDMELVPLNSSEIKKYEIRINDLLFARQSIVAEGAGKCSIVLEKSNSPVCFESHIIRVRLDENKAYPLFYYYFFQSDLGKGYLSAIRQQGVQAGIRGSDLSKLNLPYHRLLIQQKIASILSVYDDLIENNLKRIKLLEEKAKINFELLFQNQKQNWKTINLGQIVGYDIGGGWGKESKEDGFKDPAYVIRGTDIDELPLGKIENVPLRWHKKSNLKSRELKHGDLVFEVSGGSSTAGVAKSLLITDSLLDQFDYPVMCASFCKLMRPEKVEHSYLLYLFLQYLRRNRITEIFEKRSASNIVNYNWTAFLEYQQIKIPDPITLEKFNEEIEAIYKLIYNTGRQNQLLKEARDILLPRLMMGIIDVEKLDLDNITNQISQPAEM